MRIFFLKKRKVKYESKPEHLIIGEHDDSSDIQNERTRSLHTFFIEFRKCDPDMRPVKYSQSKWCSFEKSLVYSIFTFNS